MWETVVAETRTRMAGEAAAGSLFTSQELAYNSPTPGSEVRLCCSTDMSQVVKARVGSIIEEYNRMMEESQARMERLRKVVMEEAEALVGKVQEAEGRRQEVLARRMEELVERLSTGLGTMEEQEVELRRFQASLALFLKDLPNQ